MLFGICVAYVMVHWKKILMCHFQINSRLYMNPLNSKNIGYIRISMLLDPIFLLSSFLTLYFNNIIHNGGTYAKKLQDYNNASILNP